MQLFEVQNPPILHEPSQPEVLSTPSNSWLAESPLYENNERLAGNRLVLYPDHGRVQISTVWAEAYIRLVLEAFNIL